jgi:D-alanyl-D-alanine carboxypeptidase/D-alanyl-D-alanine-endopeptidase (penicillin-binding protein 4)
MVNAPLYRFLQQFFVLLAASSFGAISSAQQGQPATPTPTESVSTVKPLQRLPSSLQTVLTRAQIPLDNISVMVKEVGSKDRVLVHNVSRSMNPASVMKLVTTFSALELLGPAYAWKTEVYAGGEIKGGTLFGDLILKGSGDPKLTVERFWLLLRHLRERGLKTIQGDLILDKTLFGEIAYDPAKFDGEVLRAYNVGPDALLVNFKTVRFAFAPSVDGRSVSISPDVKPVQLDVINRVKLIDSACGEWRNRVFIDVQTPTPLQVRVTFTGNYPKSCGERSWNVSLLDHARFTGGVFAQLWDGIGGTWKGAVRVSPTPAEARLLAATESPPLADVIRDINKYSNNVMARQLLLTVGAEMRKNATDDPLRAATEAIKELFARNGIGTNELVIENGSGLSRTERVTAEMLSQLLDAAFKSNVMPEFISSMSLLGIDGTFRTRSRSALNGANAAAAQALTGQAHLKSGTLSDVRAMAGYVQDLAGRRMQVVLIINDSNAAMAQAASESLLAWVMARP